jgi:hypothetical protein
MSNHSSSDETNERAQQAPASDGERTEVLARLIRDRLEQLTLARAQGTLTPALAREFFVLEQLRTDWLEEGRPT